jgi:hypothetical protein
LLKIRFYGVEMDRATGFAKDTAPCGWKALAKDGAKLLKTIWLPAVAKDQA